MAMAAMRSGTNAISDPNTNNRMMRAPRPPSRVSSRTLGPLLSSDVLARASRPVMRTGAPAMSVAAAAARVFFRAGPAASKASAVDGGYQITPNVVPPSLETNIRSPGARVVGRPGAGHRRRDPPEGAADLPLHPGESTVVPAGSLTTCTSGPPTRGPPFPYLA